MQRIYAELQKPDLPDPISLRYNDPMKNRNLHKIIRSLCLSAIVVSTISGCSSSEKKNRIISLQKNRIQSLKKQVRRQDKVIVKLKKKKWVGSVKGLSKKSSFRKLDKMLAQGMWVSALKKSTSLQKKYPNSIGLKRRRVKIFGKMGLGKEARKETRKIQKLRAQRLSKEQMRL